MFDSSAGIFILGYFEDGRLNANFDRDGKNNYITTLPKSLGPNLDCVTVGESYKNEAGFISTRGFHHFRTGEFVAYDDKVPFIN